jgi:hypothetical protein
LREHLLPHIQEVLRQQAVRLLEHSEISYPYIAAPSTFEDNTCNFVFLKDDQIYNHNLIQFHFTTYNIRCGTDIINLGTYRCNIMLLAENADITEFPLILHHFLYAHVLGIFHVNIIYTGPGMHDYEAHCLDFLWVRWYEVTDAETLGWSSSRLDSIRFPPMNGENSFGFVDPKDILCGCYIIPHFTKGK